jgi:HEAT repeat protein
MSKGNNILLTVAISILATWVFSGFATAADREPVKVLVDKYQQAGDENSRKEAAIELSRSEPKTREDMDKLKKIFSEKDWDELLFHAGTQAIKKVKNTSLDDDLIEILKDEKPLMDKANSKDFAGKTPKEITHRSMNVMLIIQKLGEHKSQKSVPILKEYLTLKQYQYAASVSLGKIGDKSASEDMRTRAYKGEEINYGGLGLEESVRVVQDLQDKSKSDQWPKIAKQIIHIKNPEVKLQLIKLFNHEVKDVRWEAAGKFRALVNEGDVQTIIEMTRSKDDIVRTEAIHAMQNLKNIEFGDELIVLLDDPEPNVRRGAAKALGYKKITKAVPYLEKTIKDNNLRVREEAFIALYILTGKKYNYEGRTGVMERKAEREKLQPSFY